MEALDTGSTPAPLFKKRSAKARSSVRKRPATPPRTASDSDSADFSSSDDGNGHRVKRRCKQSAVVTASSAAARQSVVPDSLAPPAHAADRSTTIASTDEATRQSNWYDESSPDALSARNLLGNSKGASSYSQTLVAKKANAPPSRAVGPVKAPTNIRTITVTDFAPDVCKDYKTTGFCGFGDSCKFLHAREDYKQGWELDRDWEIGTKGKKASGKTVASASRSADAGDDSDADDAALLETIPFACVLCKRPYSNPVVTRCGHYFCEACALQRYRKAPSCAVCGAGTGGVFNGAKGLKRLLERKRERARKRKEREREEGGEAGSDDEDDEDEGEGEREGEGVGEREGERKRE
ncbi:MAG: RNA-splicing factor [Thelocarpon impressellum]|nr:MAG: RNA-splicing factor [Thelocarpon impressellum]